MPTAVPMMAASASGVSITRWEPNFRWRSSVTRKTPPSTPTSSPRISTSGSRSISCRSARLSAFTMLSLVMGVRYRASGRVPTVGGLPQGPGASCIGAPARRQPWVACVRCAGRHVSELQPGANRGWPASGALGVIAASGAGRASASRPAGPRAVRARGRRPRAASGRAPRAARGGGRHLGVDVVEDEERVGRRRRLEAPHRLRDLLVHPLLEPVLQEVLLLEVGAEARERVLLLPRRHLLLGPILSGIVRGRVDAKAVRHALDH